VRSADYAISQFRFLKRLLFVHGRWGYMRVSSFICYYFYKNIVLVFTEIYFAFNNSFSGQIFFADMLPLLYNSLYTSWPCIFSFSLERDLDFEISMNSPILYAAGQKQKYFNLKIFWSWIMFSIFHGVLAFFCTSYVLLINIGIRFYIIR
jgi:magnesium-transporting ATPase (P-type)